MNPCPCGWRGHPSRPCSCSPDLAARYAGKISGPLLDRLDVYVELPPSKPDWLTEPPGEASGIVRERVQRCRERQYRRQGKANALLTSAELERHCPLSDAARALLLQAMQRLNGSARAAHRALRVARSVADLAGQDVIDVSHLAQALQYRKPG